MKNKKHTSIPQNNCLLLVQICGLFKNLKKIFWYVPKRALLVISISGIIFPHTLQADSQIYYRWVDEAGVTHYGARAPENSSSKEIVITTNQPTLIPGNTELKSKAAESGIDKEEVDKIKLQNRKLCKAERERIVNLERKSLKRVNENGKSRLLTRDEVAKRLEDSKKYIQEACL